MGINIVDGVEQEEIVVTPEVEVAAPAEETIIEAEVAEVPEEETVVAEESDEEVLTEEVVAE